jgi:DNA-directed RNA polymerase subunit K/omega
LKQIEMKEPDYTDIIKEAEKTVKQALKEIGEML